MKVKCDVSQKAEVAEMARQEVLDKYGDDAYIFGLKVHTTVSSHLQTAADNALQLALHQYDERHRYRGLPHKKFKPKQSLLSLRTVGDSQQAVVSSLSAETIAIITTHCRR